MRDNVQTSIEAISPDRVEEINISDIHIGHRFREDFGDVEGLIKSIEQNGLFHPIVVAEGSVKKYQLLAGGRRLFACTRLEHKTIQANIYPKTLTQLDRNIIELCENIDRKDMAFNEEVAITKQIHLSMQQKFGKKRRIGNKFEGHSMFDTAVLLGQSKATVSKDILLAEALEVIPELKNAKNKKEAVKILEKLRRTHDYRIAESAAEKLSKDTTIGAAKKKLIANFITGNALELIKTVPNNSIDLVEADTPFAVNLKGIKKGQNVAGMDEYVEWSENDFRPKIKTIIAESTRVLKDGGWLIWWYAYRWTNIILEELRLLSVGSVPAIWVKNNGQTSHPNLYLGSQQEPFFYARKGEAEIVKQGRLNVFQYNGVSSNKNHPAQKPIALMEDIYSTFVKPGSKILIPFLGSGSGILAASNYNCDAFGWDMADTYKSEFVKTVVDNDGEKYTDGK